MITAAWIVATITAFLALLLELVPGLRKRWDALSWEQKRFAWLTGCLILGAAPWALGCLGALTHVTITIVPWAGTCELNTLATGLQIGFTAYFASQAAQGVVHGIKVVAAKKGA